MHFSITFDEQRRVILRDTSTNGTSVSYDGFIHRDIKPANILISCRTPLTVNLADFGLAKHDRNGPTDFKTFVGTYAYAALETHTEKRKPYTYAVDIFSLGIVALELAYGLPKAAPEEFSLNH
ncbi:Calcium/calmodulin-dependent protein kinase type 1G [Teratosphaeria destructans]|uniref:Calcium/calmodulin-dependent protein kinase type 1G n=1 Tax=Teratosphaeria destructans TaxID=418781 RepID=A0A9W7SR26_9PEZI|nr:Calcium/calmodulin-dependent protein kinase type 1G [Teratosphaeria destructans]